MLYSFEELMEADLGVTPIIADGLLDVKEYLGIAGESEAGKSYLSIQMGLELVSGGNFFGFNVPKPVSVLYIQSEIGPKYLQDRVRRLGANYTKKADLFILDERNMKLNTKAGRVAFKEHIDLLKPEVVIIDPLRAFFAGDENSSEKADEFFSSYSAITEAALVFIHHYNKPSEDPRVHQNTKFRIRGAGAWTDRPSTIMSLSEESYGYKLKFEKVRNMRKKPEPRLLGIDNNTSLFNWKTDAPQSQMNERIMFIHTLLRTGPVSNADLLAKTGWEKARLSEVMSEGKKRELWDSTKGETNSKIWKLKERDA